MVDARSGIHTAAAVRTAVPGPAGHGRHTVP